VRARFIVASMKSEFVAAVTHELKTPVASIRLVADTLAKGRSSQKAVQEYARLLSTEALRLGRSVDNLLTYARYADSRTPESLTLRPVAVGDLVWDALESFRPTLEQLKFKLTLDLPNELPLVLADRAAVIEALENIIDNAIKYSIDTRSLGIIGRAIGRQVVLTISDQGIGIPSEELDRVIDRFYRGSNTKTSGSGLGLAIAHRILAHHKATILLRSAIGVGTEVEITFIGS